MISLVGKDLWILLLKSDLCSVQVDVSQLLLEVDMKIFEFFSSLKKQMLVSKEKLLVRIRLLENKTCSKVKS